MRDVLAMVAAIRGRRKQCCQTNVWATDVFPCALSRRLTAPNGVFSFYFKRFMRLVKLATSSHFAAPAASLLPKCH